MLLFLLTIPVTSTFGQKNILKYSIDLLSDTTITDTIKINVSYTSDLGSKKGYIKIKRSDSQFSIQVFWKGAVDSVGFLTEDFLLDTSYSTSTRTLVSDLKSDYKSWEPNKILNLTQWTYVFLPPNRTATTSHDKRGLYLYHRLRYNSFLIL